MKELQYILGYLLINYKFTLNEAIDNIINYREGNMETVFMSPSKGAKLQKL